MDSKRLVQELKDVEKLLGFNCAPVLQESLLNALLKKIDTSNVMLPSDYVTMLEAVSTSSLQEEKKTWVQNKLMARAVAGEEGAKGNKIVKSPQSLVSIAAYMTVDEMQQLMSGDITQAPHLIVKRLRLAGVTSIKEDTKRYCVALLVQSMLWHGMQMPDADYTYMLATQFTNLFHASKVESKVTPMKVYPELPTEMGDEWIQKVYGEERPCLKTLPQLPEIASQVCVRSTNSNLTINSKKRLQGKQTAPDFGTAEFIQALKDLVQKPNADNAASSSKPVKLTIFDQHPSPRKALTSEPSAVDLCKQRKQMGQGTSPAKATLALANEPAAVDTETPPKKAKKHDDVDSQENDIDMNKSDAKAKQTKTLEEFEQEAFELLMKRPASAHKCIKNQLHRAQLQIAPAKRPHL